MPRPFGRPINKFRRRPPRPPEMLRELRQSLQHLAETIQESVKMLERFEDRTVGPAEEQQEAPSRDSDPLIPTRRSQLLAKIDMGQRRRRRD